MGRHPFQLNRKVHRKGDPDIGYVDKSKQVRCIVCGAEISKRELLAGDEGWVRDPEGWKCSKCERSM